MATPSELMARPLVTVNEFQQIVPMSRSASYSMTRDGTLEVVKVGRRVLIKTESIRKLIGGEK